MGLVLVVLVVLVVVVFIPVLHSGFFLLLWGWQWVVVHHIPLLGGWGDYVRQSPLLCRILTM